MSIPDASAKAEILDLDLAPSRVDDGTGGALRRKKTQRPQGEVPRLEYRPHGAADGARRPDHRDDPVAHAPTSS